MSLEDTIGHYAKNTWNAVKRPLAYVAAATIILTTFNANEVQAQSREVMGDTLNGTGFFLTKDIESGEIIAQVNLYLTPEEMQMVIPDTTYYFQTSYSGSINYKLPVYIDSAVGIEESLVIAPKVFPNFGSEINIVFPKHEKGIVKIYNLNGSPVKQKYFNTNNVYLLLTELKTGMYIYSINTESGFTFSGKFLKQNTPAKGPSPSPTLSSRAKHSGVERSPMSSGSLSGDFSPSETPLHSVSSGRNDNHQQTGYDYEATYWARWERQDYITDSMLFTIHDGSNSAPIVFNLKTINTYVNKLVYFGLRDTTGGNNINITSDLFIWPDSVEMIVLDTVYNGEANYFVELPVYIDTIPDDTIYGEHFAANYWIKWTPPIDTSMWGTGHFTDSSLVTITDTTDFVILYATPVPQLTPNQDISGIVTNTNTGNPINNALIEVEQVGSGTLYTATSTSDGSFVVNGLPLGESFLFRAGGVTGKEAVKDFPYDTPEEIINLSDSVNVHFGVSLLDDVPTSTTLDHVKNQNLHGTNQDTIFFYLGNSFNTTEKNWIKNSFITLQADENNVYVFTESFTPLNNIGINIESGTNNTQTYNDEIITPLGNTLYPVIYANSTMSTGDYKAFVHEVKRALGYDEVGWVSVMEANAATYTLEDKDIAREASRMYWNATYNGLTNIPIEYIAEDMSSKSSSQPIKDVKGRIDELNKIAEEKAKVNNVEINNYNTNSSYGNVEFNYSQPENEVEKVKEKYF